MSMDDKEMLMQVIGGMGEIKEGLKNIQRQLDKQDSDFKKTIEDHEARLRTIESAPAGRWNHLTATIISVLATAAATAVAVSVFGK